MSSEEASPSPTSSRSKNKDANAKIDPDDNKYAKKPTGAKSRSGGGIMIPVLLLVVAVMLGALYLHNGPESGSIKTSKLNNEPSHNDPSETLGDTLKVARVEGTPGEESAEEEAEEDEENEEDDEEGDENEEEEEEEEPEEEEDGDENE